MHHAAGAATGDPRFLVGPQTDGTLAVARPTHSASAGSATTLQLAVKRAFDITVSALLLMLLAPLMLVVALAIVLESPGPVFYRAPRVGRDGRLMSMFKFRKMREDASGLRLTTAGDARLTRVGALLTKSKLDELPQFLNVLRGEMSLIGPRPEDPGFVARRQGDYDRILRVRPGITGLSQIAFAEESRILSPEDPLGHYLNDIFPQKCALDRLYAANPGLAMDLRIFGWSLVAVLLRRQVAVHRDTGKMRLRRRPVANVEQLRPAGTGAATGVTEPGQLSVTSDAA